MHQPVLFTLSPLPHFLWCYRNALGSSLGHRFPKLRAAVSPPGRTSAAEGAAVKHRCCATARPLPGSGGCTCRLMVTRCMGTALQTSPSKQLLRMDAHPPPTGNEAAVGPGGAGSRPVGSLLREGKGGGARGTTAAAGGLRSPRSGGGLGDVWPGHATPPSPGAACGRSPTAIFLADRYPKPRWRSGGERGRCFPRPRRK